MVSMIRTHNFHTFTAEILAGRLKSQIWLLNDLQRFIGLREGELQIHFVSLCNLCKKYLKIRRKKRCYIGNFKDDVSSGQNQSNEELSIFHS